MTQGDVQREVIEFLSRPDTYGVVGPVERHETHASIVFLAGERAYKLKRAVHYPYLDYGTPERRRTMCEAELAVNSRTAPDLYVGVAPILREGAALRVGSEESGARAVDWVVVMRRFPQGDLFEQLRRQKRLNQELIRAAAETVAALHKTAEVRRDFGGAEAMKRVVRQNIAILGHMAGRPFHAEKIKRLAALTEEILNALSDRLDRRRDQGFVRRCHGDLHLNNICLYAGRPVLFDAIEFNDDFACIDVFYDLAFLLMDLDRHGLRALANTALNGYLENTADYDGVAVLPLFLSCRAAVRAHVTVTTAEKMSMAERPLFVEDADRLLDRAINYLEPAPRWVIGIGGVSGSGKSVLARAIAPSIGRAPGAVVLRSDILRKRLCGVDDRMRLPPSAYTPEMHERVYGEVRSATALLLAGGQSVVVDAVHGGAEERDGIEAVARDAGAQFAGLWLQAPPEVLEARLAARKADVSDATAEVMRAQLQAVLVPDDWRKIDASQSAEDTLARASLSVPVCPSFRGP